MSLADLHDEKESGYLSPSAIEWNKKYLSDLSPTLKSTLKNLYFDILIITKIVNIDEYTFGDGEWYWCTWWNMMTSTNGNIFRVTVPLWVESTCHWWISHTKASDAELWCFDLRLNKRLRKQSRCLWFETPPRSLWCHYNSDKELFIK